MMVLHYLIIKHLKRFDFFDGGKYLPPEKSQMSQKGSMYVLEILSYSEAQKKIAAQASADIMTDEEMKAMAARRMTYCILIVQVVNFGIDEENISQPNVL